MERLIIEGDNPVREIFFTARSILSTTIHIYRGNPGEPSSKAKYVARTDSELVP